MTERSQAETWIAAAKGGDQLALAKLLATCDPRLRARAQARMDAAMKSKHGPDDVLQEAYLQIVRQIRQFQGEELGAFITWANVILDHKLVDARRALHARVRDIDREVPVGVRAESSSYWYLLDEVYTQSGTPSRVIRREEALGALLACVTDLSEIHRDVIRLRYLEGLSVAQVAARLDKTEAAVVALSKRALEALRKSMDRLGEFSHG